MRLQAETKTEKGFLFKVVAGAGEISSNKSILFPRIGIEGPVLTADDVEDMEYANRHFPSILWYFFSFTQRGEDVDQGKSILAPGRKCVCKPENEMALGYLREMAKRSDMLMVPRGDARQAFGSQLPHRTRMMIKESLAVGTPPFVATGTTASMMHAATLSQGDEHALWANMEDGACGFMESDATVKGGFPELVPGAVKKVMAAFRNHESEFRALR